MARTANNSRSITHFLDDVKHAPDHLISSRIILDLCGQLGHRFRRGPLDPVHAIHLFLLQVLHGNTAITHLRRLSPRRFTASAYCQARRRLPLELFQRLFRTVTDAMFEAVAGCVPDLGFRGRGRVIMLDGSSFSMPDTPQLMDRFGHPTGQKRGCAFPVAHLMMMIDLATGLIVQTLTASWTAHDLTQSVKMLGRLKRGDIALGDRAFGTWGFLTLVLQHQRDAVVRAHGRLKIDFNPDPSRDRHKGGTYVRLYTLGKNDQVIEWFKPKVKPRWMKAEEFAALPPSIIVRATRYHLHRKGFRTKTVTLLTTLVDHERHPAADLAALYGRRWEIETAFRHLKRTMNMRTLRCMTVDGVEKELLMHALAYNVVRMAMVREGARLGIDPQRISFADALREACSRWRDHLQSHGPDSSPSPRSPAPIVIPHRPGRIEPRLTKRRPDQQRYLIIPRAEARQRLLKQRLAA